MARPREPFFLKLVAILIFVCVLYGGLFDFENFTDQ